MSTIITTREYIRDSILDHYKFVEKYSIQLFAVNENGKPLGCATGILLDLSNRKFLVTATHSVADLSFVAAHPTEKGNKIHYLSDIALSSKPEFITIGHPGIKAGSLKDDIDLAIIELKPNVNQNELKNYSFLKKENILISHKVDKSKICLVFGYLASNSKTKVNPIDKTIKRRNRFAYAGKWQSSKLHIDVSYDYKNNDNIKPVGVSGGGIWLRPKTLYHKNEIIPSLLVGICIEHHSNERIIKGIRIDFVTEFLRQKVGLGLIKSKFKVDFV